MFVEFSLCLSATERALLLVRCKIGRLVVWGTQTFLYLGNFVCFGFGKRTGPRKFTCPLFPENIAFYGTQTFCKVFEQSCKLAFFVGTHKDSVGTQTFSVADRKPTLFPFNLVSFYQVTKEFTSDITLASELPADEAKAAMAEAKETWEQAACSLPGL